MKNKEKLRNINEKPRGLQKNQCVVNTTRSYAIPHILVHVGSIFIALKAQQLL